ncbi:MAG TPA: carboxylate-amine ligase [Steroidobacteraceae bacterium]|nr:carboxylate-amine ligase [Steroidobacteraceae bacterium]
MAVKQPPFTVGIEEEYLLVDLATRDLDNDPPAAMLKECTELGGGQVTPEFLRSQIEIGTRVCTNMQDARAELARLRGIVVQVARRYGLAPIAASTHPFARAMQQKHTEKDRYFALAREMQAAARRMVICGMHVHVGIEDDELRIDLMNQLSYFLPHLLAMSCSSPFWEGENSGLKSFRLTIFNALPRTGLPERFASYAEYQRHINTLIQNNLIQDTSKIWWDLRPSWRYPTLETRIMDCCTSLDDSVALAALNVCVLRMLYRARRRNQQWRVYPDMLVNENRWRAMRYSFDEGLLDLAKGQLVPFSELLEEMIELVREDAQEMGCVKEIEHTREIMRRGTSAHRQVQVYEEARKRGASEREALNAVVDWLVRETASGTG